MTNYKNLSNWCGAKPTFFNKKSGAQSALMDDVIDWNNAEIDREGLYYYLRNGYSSFGKTFVKDVVFSRPWSDEADSASLADYNQFIEQLNGTTKVKSVLEKIEHSIADDIISANKILLPMSGGLDSRTLAILTPRKQNVSAYSYNLVQPAERCHENGIGKLVCNKLGIPHDNINLNNPYLYTQKWFANLGLCAQSHGMYHYEFYEEIEKKSGPDGLVLSGIVGDAWSGKINTKSPKKSDDLFSLGYSHGQSIPANVIKFKTETKSMDQEFRSFAQYWDNPKFRMYYLVTTKMMLLRFLLMAPRNLGFEVASPYVEPDVCANILNLPIEQWSNRLWQKEWLSRLGMHYSEKFVHFNYSTRNDLIYNWAVSNERDEPLDIAALADFVDPQFLTQLNQKISKSFMSQLKHRLVGTPKVGGVLRQFGIIDNAVQRLNWYNILLPVSKFLRMARRA